MRRWYSPRPLPGASSSNDNRDHRNRLIFLDMHVHISFEYKSKEKQVMNGMRWYLWIMLVLFVCVFGAGCLSSRAQNTQITVLSEELDSFNPVNIGSFDFYTADFRVENPTNRTFDNIEVQVELMPTTAYCHSQSATFDIPSMTPYQKLKETFSFSEFADLDCAYNFSSSVTSDQT